MTVPAVAQDWNLSEVGHLLRDPSLSYEEYEQACTKIGIMYGIVRSADAEIKFAVGDAILAGEQIFGDDCYQAVEAMGISEEVRAECVRVCRKVPRSTRRKGLTWSHHRAVAALPPADQKEWLRKVAEEGLSHHALRDELRNGAPPKAITTCRCCGRAFSE